MKNGGNTLFHDQSFKRAERLKSRKYINLLFRSGEQARFFPLLLFYYSPGDENLPAHQILISVPKKNFRKAVLRNRIKRQIREAWRRNKYILYNNWSGLPFLLGYVYLSKNVPRYQEIEAGMLASLKYLIRQQKQ